MTTPTPSRTSELDVRINILNSILRSPHLGGQKFRNKKEEEQARAALIKDYLDTHTRALTGDPLFYLHLAAWYNDKGEVRDHKHLFTARLLTSSPDLRFRPVGRLMLSALSPFEAERVARFAKEHFRGAPRFLRESVRGYLRDIEGSDKRFDGAAARSRNSLRSLYASFHVKPGKRAQNVLFDDEPPEGSQRWVIKQLGKVTPQEAARMIADNRIPLPVAVGAVRITTPAVWVALLTVASPQEVLNSLQSIEKRGLLQDPEVKALVEEKIAAAQTDKRVSTLKGLRAAEKVVDEGVKKAVEKTVDTRLAEKATITRSTIMLVDRSGSMEESIEVAREIAALISPLCQAGLWVYAFNTTAEKITARETTRAAWTEAFRYVGANGGTSIGCGLKAALGENIQAEQVIIISDGRENQHPMITDVLRDYAAKYSRPDFVFVKVDAGVSSWADTMLEMSINPLTTWEFKGDFYSLPNLLPLLAQPSAAQLVEEIMKTPVIGWDTK